MWLFKLKLIKAKQNENFNSLVTVVTFHMVNNYMWFIGCCFGWCTFRTFPPSQKFLLDTAELEPIEELMYFKAFSEVDAPNYSFLCKAICSS